MNSAETRIQTVRARKDLLDGNVTIISGASRGDRRVHRQDLRRAVGPKYARAYLRLPKPCSELWTADSTRLNHS